MILKKFLGEILTDFGFISNEQLEEALKKQRELFDEKTLRRREAQDKLVSDARMASHTQNMPMLGQILLDLEFVTEAQIDAALKEQETFIDVYKSLKKEKMGIALEVISTVNSSLDLAEVMANLMRNINRVTDAEASTLMLLDELTGELVFSIPNGPNSDKIRDIRLPKSTGVAGWVAEHEKYLLISDARTDSRFNPEIDQISGYETKTILCVPMKAKTKLIGAIEAVNKINNEPFSIEDALMLNIVATNAAMAIENARIFAQLKMRILEKYSPNPM
jgi:transcriptional regulator with GAF, ATPase, and Fis domain